MNRRMNTYGLGGFFRVTFATCLLLVVSALSGACAPPGGLPAGNDNGGPTGNENSNSQPVDNENENAPPPVVSEWFRPSVDTTWQWQLQPSAGGAINTNYDVDVYDLDLFDVPDDITDELHANGRRIICYFSAGSYEAFRDDASEFGPAELGNPLEGFADERWLDVRSANVRRIMLQRLDLAAARGCDGVEPDNVDGYDNVPGFDFTADDQLAYNRFLAGAAHERGLAVGLKNALALIPALVDHFDFSVNEQCHEYDECEALLPFIEAGKPVFNAEYESRFVDDPQQRQSMCAEASALGLQTLVLPLDLDDSFRFSCGE